jgi:hypothetical protein
MLGDRWGLETAEPNSAAQSVLSADYYRDKIREFQVTMNGIDSAYREILTLLDKPYIDTETWEALDAAARDYEARRAMIKQTAEAMNMGAAAWNAFGGRMPQLSIPGTLGFLPFVPPAAFLAAVAAAGGLILWASGWLETSARIVERFAMVAAADTPEQKAEIVASWQRIENAKRETDGSPLAQIAGLVKWGAIAALAFVGYRAWRASRS